MESRHNCRRFDDTEIRSKTELVTELQACQVDLEKQNHYFTVEHLTPNKIKEIPAANQIDRLVETTNCQHELLHDNRRLIQNLFKIQEEERRLLARELHDELGQWLTAIFAEAETIAIRANKDVTIHASSKAISECTKEMHKVIHGMLYQLRPALLDTLGLADALHELKKHWCAHHSHITLDLKLTGSLNKLGEPINTTLFRIVQEALNNICSHAHATQAQVLLSREAGMTSADDCLLLQVEDNGKGYDLEQSSSGLGLLGMRERTIAAGGEFTVHSKPNQGTQIHVKLPLNSSNKSQRRRADDR